MNDDRLNELFRHLPREIAPPHDPWPAVARRIRQPRHRWVAPVRIAAAVALFAAGMIAGRLLPAVSGEAVDGSSPFLAAVEVQHAGTAYVQALARLSASNRSDPAIVQGREAARATFAAIERMVPSEPPE